MTRKYDPKMDFQIRLSNDAIIQATFEPASGTSFIEERETVTMPTSGSSGRTVHRSWRITMQADGAQPGYEPRDIQGGLGTLIRDDQKEFTVGIHTHEYREITPGKNLHFSTSNQDIIEFIRTMPQVER